MSVFPPAVNGAIVHQRTGMRPPSSHTDRITACRQVDGHRGTGKVSRHPSGSCDRPIAQLPMPPSPPTVYRAVVEHCAGVTCSVIQINGESTIWQVDSHGGAPRKTVGSARAPAPAVNGAVVHQSTGCKPPQCHLHRSYPCWQADWYWRGAVRVLIWMIRPGITSVILVAVAQLTEVVRSPAVHRAVVQHCTGIRRIRGMIRNYAAINADGYPPPWEVDRYWRGAVRVVAVPQLAFAVSSKAVQLIACRDRAKVVAPAR